jgi:RNA polymerase sigma-70 factor (ECF subfamily)
VSGSSDQESPWLDQARAGSPEAIGCALETYRRYLLLIAERRLAPELQAKGGASDLVQETFCEAQRDFAQFRGTTDAELRRWLRQMLINNVGVFTRRFRDARKRAVGREIAIAGPDSTAGLTVDPAASTPTPSALAANNEREEALQQALAKLPEEYRRVLHLRFQEELSFAEIGAQMGRSSEAARKLWARAVTRLREVWEGPQ